MSQHNPQSGFTLVEAMLAMVIVSIGALALQSFYGAVIRSEQLSLERLTAVHLAEQIIEEWQQKNTDLPPTVTCKAGPVALQLNTPALCTLVGTGATQFTIKATSTPAMAPMPATGVPTWSAMPAATDSYGAPILDANGTPIAPKIRTVKISWDYKGDPKSILLTHITAAP